MTYSFLNKYFTIEVRNGFGFDIEACDGRPITLLEDNQFKAGALNGIVILVPFFMFSVGRISVIEYNGENNE